MVSIVLCTYNREKSIGASIDSIRNQTNEEWELIIVDDGSTDGTRKKLEEYQDERIKCIFLPENSYYCYAANVGIREALGEYVAFATSDDIWESDKLEKQVAYLTEHPECGAVFSKVTLIGENGENVEDKYPDMVRLFDQKNRSRAEWLRHFWNIGNCLSHPSSVVRKSVLDEIGGYDLLYAQLADFELWIRILLKTDIYVLQDKLVGYRWYSSKKQISAPTEEKQLRSINEFLLIKRRLLELMTDEQLIEVLGNQFRNPESSSPIELEFERAFLLMEKGAEYSRYDVLGLQKMEEVLRIPGAAEVLKSRFHIRLQDLYSKNGKKHYVDKLMEERLEYLERENVTIRRELESYQREYASVVQSNIWRATKPLRVVLDKVKRKNRAVRLSR